MSFMDTPQAKPAANPLVGPRSFRHGEQLYGRDREARQLLDLLIAERIVLFHSPSGAGKTSLIEAALKDRLSEKKFCLLPTVRLNVEPLASQVPLSSNGSARPNRCVLSALLCLEDGLDSTAERLTPDQLVELATPKAPVEESADSPALWGLAPYLERRWPRGGRRRQAPVLIFDQFEEVLTVHPTDRRAKHEFFASLGEALRDGRLWALFAMREEHLAALAPYVRSVPTCLNTTYRLDLLTPAAAKLAIQRPAAAAGGRFDDDAARELIRDLSASGPGKPDPQADPEDGTCVEPVQLQVVCRQLWDKPRPDPGKTTLQDVRSFGEVGHALGSYYAQTVAEVARATNVPERAIRDWFGEKLTTPQGVRRQVFQGAEQSEGLDNRAVEALVRAHLVRPELRHGSAWYELAHDRLIPPMQHDNEAWREQHLVPLQRRAKVWAIDHSETLLLKGKELEEAETWSDHHVVEMNTDDRAFLGACRQRREQSAQRRRGRFWKAMAWALGDVVILAGLLVIWVLHVADLDKKKKNSEHDRLVILRSQRLAGSAQNALSGDPELSILLATEGIKHIEDSLGHLSGLAKEVGEGTEDAREDAADAKKALTVELNHGLQAWRQVWIGRDFKGDVEAVAFSRDRYLAAVGGAEKPGEPVAFVWEVRRSDHADREVIMKELFHLSRQPAGKPGATADLTAVAFSGDGKILATGGSDNRILLWDAVKGTLRKELPRAPDLPTNKEIKALAFSPNDQFLVSGGDDHHLILWDAGKGSLVSVHSMPAAVTAVAFDPTGRWLIAGCENGAIAIWDSTALSVFAARTGGLLGSPHGQGPLLAASAFLAGRVDLLNPELYQLVWTSDSADKSQPTAGVAVAVEGTRPAAPTINCLAFNPRWWGPGASGEITVATGADDGLVHYGYLRGESRTAI
jgi:WD40 repeat protein